MNQNQEFGVTEVENFNKRLVSYSLTRVSLSPSSVVLKVKWVSGMSEPTILYLVKNSTETMEGSIDNYYMDLAVVKTEVG